MANIISGQIIAIGDIQTIPSKNGGEPFIKREFVIRALRFNPNDGTPELSEYNTPSIEVQGMENCRMLDSFKLGDVVRVSFNLEGRSVVSKTDGTVRYFNTVRAYAMEAMNVKPQPTQPQQQPATVPAGSPAGQQGYNPFASDTLPFD